MAGGSKFTASDLQNPLFLHPSDGPTSICVTKLQGASDYRAWKRSVEIQLSAKRKLGFVDGSVKRSTEDTTEAAQWDTCNHMIKSDVETQGEFIRFLIKEVEDAKFTDIQDAVAFVRWLDDELSYLVDERAVLKHFQWPEKKGDILREAVFGYCDVKELVSGASSFRDDPHLPFIPALKKMQTLFEKLQDGAYNLSRTRELAGQRYEGFQIPIDWMLESGFTSQMKLASVKLATNYMKRVLAELELVGGGCEKEELIIEGVRFAFRVHQFAGGFDAQTMRTFQHLRDKARLCSIQCHNEQQNYACRSTAC